MRKLIILLILLMLCGCDGRISKKDEPTSVESITKLMEAGFSNDAAIIIDNYSGETKEYLLTNYTKQIEKLVLDNLSEEEVIGFLTSNLDVDTYEYVIKNSISEVELDEIKQLSLDSFYMFKNLELYLEYKNDFNDTRSLVEYVNTKAYKKGYEEYENSDLTKDILMIASKIYYLDDYVPNDLKQVDDGYYALSTPELRSIASDAYKKMTDDARNDGLDFYISTAYRSYDFQNNLYNKYLQTDPQEVVDTYSSRPGFSDHQIGLSCDIRTKDKAFNEFDNTNEAKWLKDNAYKYGFIMRYPEGKENITGYIHESWHYRYVGEEAATIIYNNNITFDEYYAYYVEQ